MPAPYFSNTDKKNHRQGEVHRWSLGIPDPGQDRVIPIGKAAYAAEVISARAWTTGAALAAGTTDYVSLSLLNGGSVAAGTSIVAAAIGGTAGWPAAGSACVQSFTIDTTTGTKHLLAAGDILCVSYDETGTVANNFAVEVNIVYRDL